MDTVIASELQLIEPERSYGVGDRYAGRKDATVIDIEYGNEEVDDADDDEQALMHHQVEHSGSLRWSGHNITGDYQKADGDVLPK